MNTNTEITADAARARANGEYGHARANLMEAQRQYHMEPGLLNARALVAAHEEHERAERVWSSAFPEWHYNR